MFNKNEVNSRLLLQKNERNSYLQMNIDNFKYIFGIDEGRADGLLPFGENGIVVGRRLARSDLNISAFNTQEEFDAWKEELIAEKLRHESAAQLRSSP